LIWTVFDFAIAHLKGPPTRGSRKPRKMLNRAGGVKA